MSEEQYSTKPIQFNSHGQVCHGVLYQPSGAGNTKKPLVLMANGYGAEYCFGLLGFAEKFASAGIPAMLFDYRGFGKSEGEPSQLIDPEMQLQDWQSALGYAKTLDTVDNDRIAVWGSSFGGGHAVSVAAANPDIKVAVAQVPHLCTKAAFKAVPLTHALKGTCHAIWDMLTSPLLGVHTVPIVGTDSTYGVMNHEGWLEGYTGLKPEGSEWENAIPARSLIKCGTYSPIDNADQIKCPLLIVYAQEDQGVPLEPFETMKTKVADLTLESFPGDHFGAYTGSDYHEQVAEIQLNFLIKNL